jgi:hypothetical protein
VRLLSGLSPTGGDLSQFNHHAAGHCYEADYSRQRAEKHERAERIIPEITALLEAARVKLAQNAHDIDHARRIEGDIEFMKAALYGQLGRAA